MPVNKKCINDTYELIDKALNLEQQAKGLTDIANDWAAMGSDNVTVDDLRERAARLREESRKIKSNKLWSQR